MNAEILFPGYVPRAEEQQIRQEAARVAQDRTSRAVLLYGSGGIGKTWLVRQLARAGAADPATVWLDPIDIDDSEYWLLSNLERLVAQRLDPGNEYFGPYLEYLSRLPSYTRSRIGHETVVSHLGRIKRVFVECYKRFIEGSGKTVVIIFDTVETIRGMYLLLTLTQWMKALPGTLFVLSGRPLPGQDDRPDPIRNELEDPYQGLPVMTIQLGAFTQEAAVDYLEGSGVAGGLTEDEKVKIVLLTRGHPLWLAFAVAYLADKGVPEEALTPLSAIARDVPYQATMTQAGQSLHEAFKRRLVAPYRDTDFWHEAVKRLAVVRESVNQPIWQELMADRTRLEGAASLDDAWGTLLRTPWIRPRANHRYVTLHDAVAEELAQLIIPLHDQDKQWRHRLWRQAARIYGELAESREQELTGRLAALDEVLEVWGARPRLESERRPPTEEESRFIQDATELDAEKRELCQLKAVHLYYEILSDFPAGCRQFLELLDQAKSEHDVLFQDLLAFEMQRFLPSGVHRYAFGDVIGEVIDEFRVWLLSSEGRELYLEVGLSMANYLIRDEQPETAIDLLGKLPMATADHRQRYHMQILLGNACMRIAGRVKDGLPHFHEALAEAIASTSPDRPKLIAAAHKELGFYYRNEGLWGEADHAYQEARNAISATLSARSSEQDREEMASIQTNWAYVKGLGGSYREGTNLVESAITVRHRLKKYQEEGISWSVCGEVYRYARRFQKAWAAYAEAEQIFQGQRNWSWLGLIYQEQAICLFQATQDGISLTTGRDPIERAKHLITLALDLCRDLAVRGQPSALNRAGRIFGHDDFDTGLGYLAEGIDWARRLSDGWFWFANLIEYVELSYRAWVKTGQRAHLDRITARAPEIRMAMSEYEFPDLKGRWNLLQGHLLVHDSLETRDTSRLNVALQHYKEGFSQIAQGYVGSSGAAAISGEFETFGELVWQLSPETRAGWQEELRSAWSALENGSTLLLARLEELY
jgi:tetratricopeptide (TPR) repeat protein